MGGQYGHEPLGRVYLNRLGRSCYKFSPVLRPSRPAGCHRLVFAAIGSYVAFQTVASEDTAALGNFVYISLGLARVGLGAAGADVLASEGV